MIRKTDPSINLNIFLFTFSLSASWVFEYKFYCFYFLFFLGGGCSFKVCTYSTEITKTRTTIFFWKCRALFWGLESDGQRDADFCYQDETKHRSGKKCHSFHWRWTRGVHTQCCKDIPGTEKQQNWRRNCARVGKVSLCRLLQSEAFKEQILPSYIMKLFHFSFNSCP